MVKDINVFIVSHTHWNREWHMGLQPSISRFVRLLDQLIVADVVCQNTYAVIRIPTTDLPVDYKLRLSYGSSLYLNLPVGLIHLFDKETGDNLISSTKW